MAAGGTADASDASCKVALIDTMYCKMMYPGYFGTTTVNNAGAGEDLQRALSLTMAGITAFTTTTPTPQMPLLTPPSQEIQRVSMMAVFIPWRKLFLPGRLRL